MKKMISRLLPLLLVILVISCKKETANKQAPMKDQSLVSNPTLGNNWTQLPVPTIPVTGPPPTNMYNISFGANNKLYAALVGYNQLWQYDPATSAWSQKQNPFFNFTVFGEGGGNYVYAFTNGDNIYFLNPASKGFKQFNLFSGIWTNKANFPGSALGGVSASYTSTSGYILAGKTGADANGIAFSTLENWQYDFASNSWTARANTPGVARYNAAAYAIADKIYYGTGISTFTLINPITFKITRSAVINSDWWEYNTGSNSWTQKAAFGGGTRTGYPGFVIGSKIYLGLGSAGYFTDLRSDLWSYDPGANVWAQRSSYPPGNGYPPYLSFVGTAGFGYAVTTDIEDFWRYTAPYTLILPGMGSIANGMQ